MSDGQATDSRNPRSQTRYPGTVNASKLELQTIRDTTMNLKELKNTVYELLGVTTTKEVKAKYPNRILTKPTEWEAILNELTAKSESDTEPTELYGFPESETVLTGKTGELTEAFAIATEDDLEPDLSEPEPIDGAAWADFVRRTNPKPIIIAQVIEPSDGEPDDTFVTPGLPSVDPEAVADRVPSPDAPMAPVPLALWDFIPGYNLVAVLSPWTHYLQWLDRLYTHTFALVESTFWGYENA